MAQQVHYGGRSLGQQTGRTLAKPPPPEPRAAAVPTDVPPEAPHGWAVGNFVSFVSDQGGGSADVPDQLSLNGTVTLTPLTTLLRYPTAVPPRLAMPQAVVAPVVDGQLCDPHSSATRVPLIATDQPNAEPDLCQWKAHFQFTGVAKQPQDVVFNVPANGTVDLALIADIPAAPGTIVVVSHEDALAAAESAEDAAQSAQDAADYAASGNPGPQGPPGVGIDVLAPVEEVTFGVVDVDGRRSWVETGLDGHPTEHSIDLLGDALAPTIIAVAGQTGTVPIDNPEAYGYVYALVDSAGRMAYGVRLDGTMDIFKPGVGGVADGTVTVDKLDPATAARLWPVQTGVIFCVGDSLTAANYPNYLGAELGVTVVKSAIGGQNTAQIGARQNGYPALLTLADNTMPASGSVVVTGYSTKPYTIPGGTTGSASGTGSISNIKGTLKWDYDAALMTFTRTAAGSSLWVSPNTPWVTDVGTAQRTSTTVIWAGRNGFQADTPQSLVATIKEMVRYIRNSDGRFLVLEVPPWDDEYVGGPAAADRVKLDTFNVLLLETFRNEFVPVAQMLRGPGLAMAGITPTPQDTTDIGRAITPTSLRSDGGHPNDAGQHVIATYVAARIREKGWYA